MAGKVTPEELKALLEGDTPFALLDVREAGEYNSTHIPGSCWLPRRRLEFQLNDSAPFTGVLIVVCDDDGRRAALAADTVERMGYRDVSVLEGGINAWVNAEFSTEWGMNVPSKDFGERIEIHDHVANISADDLHARLEEGRPTVILDSRTPEEYQRFAIPGGRSIPGGELPLRITDIAQGLEQDAAIIVNCAGRTRSIIGARVLQSMGIPNVFALTNGTAGWTLAGYELERGADRVDMPQPSDEPCAQPRPTRTASRRRTASAFSTFAGCRTSGRHAQSARCTSSTCARGKNTWPGTSPAFAGSPAGRPCSAPTTSPW